MGIPGIDSLGFYLEDRKTARKRALTGPVTIYPENGRYFLIGEGLAKELKHPKVKDNFLITNPVSSSEIRFRNQNKLVKHVQIKELTGRTLIEQDYTFSDTEILIEHSLSDGIYLVLIYLNDEIKTEKLVVARGLINQR